MHAPKQDKQGGHKRNTNDRKSIPFVLQRKGENSFQFDASGKIIGVNRIQPKLRVGEADDKFEREADQVADQVVSNNEQPKVIGTSAPPVQTMKVGPGDLAQRTKEQQTEEEVQLKEDEESTEEVANVQMKTSFGSGDDSDISAQIGSTRGGGSSMDKATKSEMESGFGHDFSNVRIHTGNQAAQMNQSLGAKAFTTGNDIFFNEGQYQPDSKEGKRLLAHELTHTLQQGASGKNIQKKTLNNPPGGMWKFKIPYTSAMNSMNMDEIAAYCLYQVMKNVSKEYLLQEIKNGNIRVPSDWSQKVAEGKKSGFIHFSVEQGWYERMTGYPSSTGDENFEDGGDEEIASGPLSNGGETDQSSSDGTGDASGTGATTDSGSGSGSGGGSGTGTGSGSGDGSGDGTESTSSATDEIAQNNYYDSLEKERQIEIVNEANKRFYEVVDLPENYQLQETDPQFLKDMWLEKRNQVIKEDMLYNHIPERLEKVLKSGDKPISKDEIAEFDRMVDKLMELDEMQLETLDRMIHSGSKPVPMDYTEMRKLAELMEEFTPMDYMEYMSFVAAEAESMEDFRKSIERYLERKAEQQQEAEELEETKTKLYGLEQLYEDYKEFKDEEAEYNRGTNYVGDATDRKMDRRIHFGDKGKKKRLDRKKVELIEQMKANGFESIEDFEKYIKKYERGFEKATVRFAEEHLWRYRHKLYEEEKKLKDNNHVSALYQQFKATNAKKHFDAGDSAENKAALASTLSPTNPWVFHYSMEAGKHNAKGVKALSSIDSFLVKEEQFEHEDFADIESKKEMKSHLQEYINDKYESIKQTYSDLHTNSEYIYKLDKLLAGSKEFQGITEGSIFESIIQDKAQRIADREWFKAMTILVLAIVLTVITLGAAAPLAVAAGTISLGISIYSVFEAVEEYKRANAANDVQFLSDDPSLIWVVIAVAGAVFDVGALMPAMKSARLIKATKTFNKTADVGALEKELKAIQELGEIDERMAANILKKANAEKHTNEVFSNLSIVEKGVAASTIVPFGPLFKRAVSTAYTMAYKGVIDFDSFLLKLKAQKIIKNLDVSPEELLTLKQAFKEGQELFRTNPEIADDLFKAINEKDFVKMEEILDGASSNKTITNPVTEGTRTGSAAYKSLNVLDEQHFFSDLVDNYVEYATKFELKGGDGVVRDLYQLEGSLRGQNGIFEWIVDGTDVTHRRFIKGGVINGIPNQIVKK